MTQPTQRTWAAALLRRLGIHQTPGGVQALTGWANAEGGNWHNQAKYNPLNTTQEMPGAGNTGSQGNIKVYKDWAQGLDATVKTLKNGRYGGILHALGTGDPGAVAGAIGKTPWGTSAGLVRSAIAGTPRVAGVQPFDVPGSSQAPAPANVQRIASSSPSILGSTPASSQAPSVYDVVRQYHDATQPQTPQQPGAYGQVPFDAEASKTKIQDTVQQIIAQRSLASQPSGSAPVASAAGLDVMPTKRPKGFKGGDPVIGGTSVGGEHDTAGLPGYPAKDYFAPAGSTAVAPVSGKVIKLSGHDPKGGPTNGPHGPLGWSVYIQAADGRTYFLTHLGKRSVKVGQTIKAGTPIGTVANYDKYGTPSHIHMGVH